MKADEEETPVTMADLNITVQELTKKSSDAQDFLAQCWRTRHDVY